MTFRNLPDKVYANHMREVHGVGKKKATSLCEYMAFYLEQNKELVEILEETNICDIMSNVCNPIQLVNPNTGALVREQTFTAPGGQFNVPMGYCLDDLVVKASTLERTMRIGVTPNGEEIMSEETLPAGEIFSFRKIYYFATAATMYVTVNQTSTIIFYFKPLVA